MNTQRDDSRINFSHVSVLDGVRAAAILIVAWFHVWQQSWLIPAWDTPGLAFLGVARINLDAVPRTGYLFVDLMLLISAFCLFLPHARAMLLGEPVPDTRLFYKKRLIRILPPYLLCVFVIFFGYALPSGAYPSAAAMGRDLLATLTFTQTFAVDTYIGTHINVVLWTVAIEMQFYLLFPLLAKAFRRRPLAAYLAMVAVSELYLRCYALPNPDGLRMTLNQLIAFFGVFANGMAGAYLYVLLGRASLRLTLPWQRRTLSAGSTLLAVLSAALIAVFQNSAACANPVQVFQAEYRFLLSAVFLLSILSLSFSCRALQWVFSNRIMRFLAAISYNLYIWHQWLAVRLKDWRIPYWEGDTLPNMAGNRVWQWEYTLLVFALSIGLAALITYAFERPVSRRLLARFGAAQGGKAAGKESLHRGESVICTTPVIPAGCAPCASRSTSRTVSSKTSPFSAAATGT